LRWYRQDISDLMGKKPNFYRRLSTEYDYRIQFRADSPDMYEAVEVGTHVGIRPVGGEFRTSTRILWSMSPEYWLDRVPSKTRGQANLHNLIARVEELGRTSDTVGVERRKIDNSSNAGPVTRRIKISGTWVRSYELAAQETRSHSLGGSAGLYGLALQASADKAIVTQYSLRKEETQSLEEELTIEVRGGEATTLVLEWKKNWQLGRVIIQREADEEIIAELPFRLLVGMSFDQRAEPSPSEV
jgi:hypothetical protein